MTRTQLLLRLLFKAAWVRKDRAFTALVSVAVVATIATAALTIYSNLEGNLSREFRGFGANVVVTKASGALSPEELANIHKIVGSAGEIAPVGYAIATETTSNAKIVVGGADLDTLRRLNSSWSFSNAGQGGALVGGRVDETITHGADLHLSFGRLLPPSSPRGSSIQAQTMTAAFIFRSTTSNASPACTPTRRWSAWKASRSKSRTPSPASALHCPTLK